MGKCVSASSESELSKVNNNNNGNDKKNHNDKAQPLTQATGDSQKSKKTEDAKIVIAVEQTGSLSDDEDEEEEQLGKTNKKKSKNLKQSNVVRIEELVDAKEEEIIASINYISPINDDIDNQKELLLAPISHCGHYQNNSSYSVQNILEKNSTKYISLPKYHFNSHENDWFIFKIISSSIIKITSLSLDYDINSKVNQYPSKLTIQFLSTNSLNKIINSSLSEWSKPYIISPYPLTTTKPAEVGTEHTDTISISLSDEYLNNIPDQDQYIRISLINNYDDDNFDGELGKFIIHHLRIYGVEYNDKQQQQQQQSKQYKVDIENKFKSNISPKPGSNDARILMRDHIFFVGIESKTINNLKQSICDEYARLTKGTKKYIPKELILMEETFGIINDMMDQSILNKTLNEIGAKTCNKKTGYFITVGFC